MYPNAITQAGGIRRGQIYRRILDLIWETLTVKDAGRISIANWKFEAIPAADD